MGVNASYVISPYFHDGQVISENVEELSYTKMTNRGGIMEQVWFQQDGVPAHLSVTSQPKWIGYGSATTMASMQS